MGAYKLYLSPTSDYVTVKDYSLHSWIDSVLDGDPDSHCTPGSWVVAGRLAELIDYRSDEF